MSANKRSGAGSVQLSANTFRRHWSRELAQSPEKLVLGGEAREMTIMFSDVRGFTTISEIYKDDPQGLTALMNSF